MLKLLMEWTSFMTFDEMFKFFLYYRSVNMGLLHLVTSGNEMPVT